jgi:hypothetical protein
LKCCLRLVPAMKTGWNQQIMSDAHIFIENVMQHHIHSSLFCTEYESCPPCTIPATRTHPDRSHWKSRWTPVRDDILFIIARSQWATWRRLFQALASNICQIR